MYFIVYMCDLPIVKDKGPAVIGGALVKPINNGFEMLNLSLAVEPLQHQILPIRVSWRVFDCPPQTNRPTTVARRCQGHRTPLLFFLINAFLT
jgi:hypothetical protein